MALPHSGRTRLTYRKNCATPGATIANLVGNAITQPNNFGMTHPAPSQPLQYVQYVVLRELGRGGMASVYEGQHVELGKHAAIKVMFPSLAQSSTAATRFLREARAVAQLRHPHIVDVFDMGTEGGSPYFVMELL